MTIFSSNTIFAPNQKYIKLINNDFSVINGANNLSSISLCSVKIGYEQYQKISIQIPKGQTDYILSFPMMGIKTTFITIKPTYCGTNPNLNYLKWKFQPSSDPKWSFTNLLVLTATVDNPIPPIVIDNPNPDCIVHLEVLVSAMANDYLNDTSAFLYLNELTFDKVHTYNEVESGTLAFFNKDNELSGTVDIIDIVNITRVVGQNRIILDESSENNIVLDFITDYDTLQALSAINYVLLDPLTRYLPQPPDLTPPVITFTNSVISNSINIDLSLYGVNTFTKQDFINAAILTVIDNRDGNILATLNNIKFRQNTSYINTIVNAGTYSVEISISDIAGNISTATIDLLASNAIVDIEAPVITYTSAITASTIDPININFYGGVISANDIRVLTILNVIDNIDGILPIGDVDIVIRDVYQNIIPSITQEGNYTIEYTVADSSANIFTDTLSLQVNDTLINSAPQIYFTDNVTLPSLTASILLSNYGGTFTKTNALALFIDNVTDDMDGTIVLTTSDITFIDSLLVPVADISIAGIYTVEVIATDVNSNSTIKIITLTVNV